MIQRQKADGQNSFAARPAIGVASAPVSLSKGGPLSVLFMENQPEFRFEQVGEREEWRPIADYEGLYEVSNLGNVRSTGNVPGRWGMMPVQAMSKTLSGKRYKVPGQGYWQVKLTKNRSGKLLRVCRLVAKAFVANPNNFPQTDHIDGNPRYDVASNLEWVTNQENQKRAVRNGQHKPVRGESQPTHKISKEEALAIRAYPKPSRATAVAFGISPSQVKRIRRNESWAWL